MTVGDLIAFCLISYFLGAITVYVRLWLEDRHRHRG